MNRLSRCFTIVTKGVIVQNEGDSRSVRSERAQNSQRRSTIADVAAMAGVGLSTVSRVVRHAPSVSKETREKVERAVAATGYQSNPLARSLRNRGSLNLVAFIVPDVGDPFFADVYMNLQESALERGDTLLLGSHAENHTTQTALLRQIVEYRPSVVVIVPAPGTTSDEVNALSNQGIPVVLLDRPVSGAFADTVLAQNEVGAELLVANLVTSGRERVGIVSLPRSIWTQERRFDAVAESLASRGMRPAAVLEESALAAPSGEAFRTLYSQDVDTVLALSVPPAVGVMRRGQIDRYAPVRIGCFERQPWFDLAQPGIVSVSQDTHAISEKVDFHLERRRNDPSASPLSSVLPFWLDGSAPAPVVRA